VIVGDGPERSRLEHLKANDGRIILTGARSDLARIYRALDAFVSAARFEPFGIAIMEAMAAGLPLVLTNTDGPREFAPRADAMWAEPGDESGLARELTTAAARGRLRREYDLSPLTQDRATDLVEKFYRSVLCTER
jgi:glycosyltransferase involved in cell wall biosynthesis